MRTLIAFFKPLVAALHGAVALQCATDGALEGFYTAWVFEVFVIPGVLWGGIFLHYLSRRKTKGVAEAKAKMWNDALFVLFLVYPLVS
eukprot:COSAG04_NODE_9016_length_907_cov_1.264851_1_plen_88_part_00